MSARFGGCSVYRARWERGDRNVAIDEDVDGSRKRVYDAYRGRPNRAAGRAAVTRAAPDKGQQEDWSQYRWKSHRQYGPIRLAGADQACAASSAG